MYRERLSEERERELVQVVKREGYNHPALNILVDANRRLIYRAVRHHVHHGADKDVLMQVGIAAFIDSIDTYEFGYGKRLSSYAFKGVQWRGNASCAEQLGIPYYLHDRIGKIESCRTRYYAMCGEWPDEEQIAKDLGLSLVMVRNAIARMNGPHRAFSLDQKTDGKSKQTWLDQLWCTDKGAEQLLVTKEEVTFEELEVKQLLRHLQEDYRKVIELRFGLSSEIRTKKKGNKGRAVTLKAVGDLLGVTPERVRQIEKKAILRMRECAQGMLRVQPTDLFEALAA